MEAKRADFEQRGQESAENRRQGEREKEGKRT